MLEVLIGLAIIVVDLRLGEQPPQFWLVYTATVVSALGASFGLHRLHLYEESLDSSLISEK